MPGEYRVTLVVDGKDVATKPVRVSGDKDMPMTDAERKTWHDTALSLHEMQRVANEAAEAVTTLGDADHRGGGAVEDGGECAAERRKTAVDEVGTRLADLRRRLGLGQTGRRRWRRRRLRRPARQRPRPARAAEGPDHGLDVDAHGATAAERGELREDLTKVVADTNELITAIPAIYDALGASGAKPTALKPVGPVPPAR